MAENSTLTWATTTKINKVDIDKQRIENDTEAVMKQRVTKSTRESYKSRKITFIIWLFDQHNKYPILLQPTMYYMMQTKNLEDISRMTKQGKQSKSRHGIRSVYLEAIRTIKPYAQASISVKLEHLTFTLFSRFLSIARKNLKRGIQEQVKVKNQSVEVRLNASTYEGACSALLHLYHDLGKNKKATSPQLCPKLSSYKKVSRRISSS